MEILKKNVLVGRRSDRETPHKIDTQLNGKISSLNMKKYI
jgi:hypothetical protein